MFNLRDTEVVICIILVLLKKMNQLLSNTIAIVFFKSLLIDDFNKDCLLFVWFRFMVFNAIFNNISVISWRLVLLMEETGVPEQNYRPVASHWTHSFSGDILQGKIIWWQII